MRFDQASVLHVGTPSPEFNKRSKTERTTKVICFHKFATLSTERGESVYSPYFDGFGNQWCLQIYPGGDDDADEGMASIYLCNMSNKDIEIDFGFSFINGSGNQVLCTQLGTPNHFAPVDDTEPSSFGYSNYAKHSTLMSSLVDGALVIKVNMKVALSPPIICENPSACKVIQGLFLSNKSADIAFKVRVEEQPKDDTMKVAKTAQFTLPFPAHRLIVENCSTILADMCESNDDGKTQVLIHNVSPDVFLLMLSYIYGMKIANDEMKSHAKEIIDAADRFGVVNLKLEAETFYVEATKITMTNVMELLLYAESKNCALLKEAAMDYIVENKADVIDELSFTDIPGTLLNDVLKAFVRSEKWMSGVLHVGTPSPDFTNRLRNERTTKIICIHKFASLPTRRGYIAQSPEFEGLGNQWRLTLYQGTAEGMVSIFLCNMSNKAIKIDYSVSIIDGYGKQVAYKRTETPHGFAGKSLTDLARGFKHFAKRSTLMNLLVDGALIIKVNMKVVSPSPFILPNPSACEVIQGLFMNVKSNDIVFEVGGEEQLKNGEEKTTSMVPVTFPAHRCIVETCSTTLAELFESNGTGTSPIPIDNVSPDIFRLLLSYIYGMKIANDEMKSHAKEIIDAADRFGVVNLKLEAEASIVEGTTFTLENVKELLLYAESKNCALLKDEGGSNGLYC